MVGLATINFTMDYYTSLGRGNYERTLNVLRDLGDTRESGSEVAHQMKHTDLRKPAQDSTISAAG